MGKTHYESIGNRTLSEAFQGIGYVWVELRLIRNLAQSGFMETERKKERKNGNRRSFGVALEIGFVAWFDTGFVVLYTLISPISDYFLYAIEFSFFSMLLKHPDEIVEAMRRACFIERLFYSRLCTKFIILITLKQMSHHAHNSPAQSSSRD